MHLPFERDLVLLVRQPRRRRYPLTLCLELAKQHRKPPRLVLVVKDGVGRYAGARHARQERDEHETAGKRAVGENAEENVGRKLQPPFRRDQQ